MLFDFHNDLLTAEIKEDKKAGFNQNTVYAVWTSRLENPVTFINNVRRQKIRLTAVEDLGFMAEPGGLTGDESDKTEVLKKLKPVYASLTWNDENAFAGGASTDVGLSESGRKIIAFLEEAGILLDVAHLSRPAFFQAARAAKKPFICSHTCFDGVYGHRRNLNDLQIKTIIEIDGIIGLCLVSEFMGKTQATVDDVTRQIDYFTQKFGEENLALGTDFNGCDTPALNKYSDFNRVEEKLLKLGYSQKNIDKIFYLNARDFLLDFLSDNGESN